MSGRRQHYLPRFLQRAFRFRGEGDSALVYAHERSRVYSPNVMGLGQERDFYGSPAESGLDEAITATEDRLAAIHRRLIEGYGGEIASEEAASLISAISIRTKSMREAMGSLGPTIVSALEAHVQDEDKLREAFRKEGANPKLFNDAVAEQFAKMPHMDRNKKAAFVALARREFDRYRVEQEDEIVRQMKRHAVEFIAYLRTRAAELADTGFLRALNRDPAMPMRTERFALFSYSVAKAEEGAFYILGDCGPVGVFSDGSSRLVLGDIDDDATIDAVLLPISPELCLIGQRVPTILDTSPESVNRLSASLSHRFFVSNRSGEGEFAELRKLIGTAAPIATEDRILALMQGAGVNEENAE
jgi:hypothetical protein